MESLNSLFTILYDKIDILLNLELWKRTSQFDEQWGGVGGAAQYTKRLVKYHKIWAKKQNSKDKIAPRSWIMVDP